MHMPLTLQTCRCWDIRLPKETFSHIIKRESSLYRVWYKVRYRIWHLYILLGMISGRISGMISLYYIGYDICTWYLYIMGKTHLLVLPSPSTLRLMIWMSPLSMQACRRFSMSWSTSFALNAGFFSKSLIRSLITLALSECFEENALRIPHCLWYYQKLPDPRVEWYQSHISVMISGVISYTMWTYAVELDGTWGYWSWKSRRSSISISWSLQSLSKSVRSLCRLGGAPEWTTTAHQYWYHS